MSGMRVQACKTHHSVHARVACEAASPEPRCGSSPCRVVFKLDRTGACEEVVADDFSAIPGLPLASFTHDMFLQVWPAAATRLQMHWCL